MKFRIVVVDLRTGAEVLTREFDSWPVQIGRAKGCELLIPDEHQPELSRRHAWLDARAGGLQLTDGDSRTHARSANGTFVDGQALASGQTVELHDGDVVMLGNRFQLQFHTVESGAARAAGAAPRPVAEFTPPAASEPAPRPHDQDVLVPLFSGTPNATPSPATPRPAKAVPTTPLPATPSPATAGQLAETIGRRLRHRYEELRGAIVDERQAALRAELSAALDEVDPGLMADVLRAVHARHDAPRGEVTHAPARPATLAVDAPIGFAASVLGREPTSQDSEAAIAARAVLVLDEFLDFCVRDIRTRQDFQRELSPEVTQALGRDPNPLMNVRELADLRRWLFESTATRSDAEVRRVLRSALRRLELHGLGLIAMCEHAPRATLNAVHPDKIEARVPALFQVNPLRGYKAWELYRESVEEFLGNGTRLFDAVWSELLRIYLNVHDRPGDGGPEARASS